MYQGDIKALELRGITCFIKEYHRYTVKPFIKNTSEEFIKCRLGNFSMSFILYYGQFQYLRK